MTTRLFALVALLASGTASAEYSLAPWVQYLLGASAHNIAVSDINGDDRQDIVVTTGNGGNADAYKVQIFYQQQDGSLSAPEKISFGTTSGGDNAALVVEDLNGDRKPDILVGHAAGVTVFFTSLRAGRFQRRDFALGRTT